MAAVVNYQRLLNKYMEHVINNSDSFVSELNNPNFDVHFNMKEIKELAFIEKKIKQRTNQEFN